MILFLYTHISWRGRTVAMLEQTLLSRTVKLFVVFVEVDLSMAQIRGTLYAIVLLRLHILLFGSVQFLNDLLILASAKTLAVVMKRLVCPSHLVYFFLHYISHYIKLF